MNISYEYQIANMDVADIGGKVDVVVALHYRVVANRGGVDTQPVHSGVVYLDAPGDSFTEFSSLTKAQVEQWLKSNIDVAAVEQDLKLQIDQMAERPEPEAISSRMPAWA